MKIYCNNRYDPFDVRSYIGKDVWVHCFFQDIEIWAKFISIPEEYGSGYVTFQWVLDNYLHRSKDIQITTSCWCLNDFTIEEPLQVLTTEEFLNRDFEGIKY